jgi:polyhydroxybutyrate depolymerase
MTSPLTRFALGTLAVAALFALGAGRSPAALTTSTAHTLTVDGLVRNYFVYRPPNLAAGAHPPLVIVMHGYSGRASGVESHYHWDDEADAGGFVVVYPDGIERSWNSGNCCATALLQKVDDVKFLTTLVETLKTDEHVDPRRIYFSGMSNGALMSYRMACEAKFPIAAIGPVGGTLDIACPSPQATSVISINGRADRMIPFNGGKSVDPSTVGETARAWRGNLPAIEDVMARWRSVDRCGKPQTTVAKPVTTEIATCRGGRAVEEISIDEAGHQWPGGSPGDQAAIAVLAKQGIYVDPPSTALNATHEIWQFFSTKVSGR